MRPPPSISSAARFPVTAGIAILSIVLTLALWAGGRLGPQVQQAVEVLLPWPDTWPGHPWQFVTNIFFHVDPMHLLFNLYWTWVLGSLVERNFGSVRYLGIVLLLAAGASLGEYAFLQGGIGLSGVGYGLFGLTWILSTRDPRFAGAVDMRTVQMFLVWFVLCIVLTVMHVWNVANIAHGVGMLLGLLLGLALAGRRGRESAAGALVAVLLCVCVLGTVGRERVNFTRDVGRALAARGYRALVEKHDEEAIALLCRALAAGAPAPAQVWRNLGVAHLRAGQTREAINAFRQAMTLDPSQQDLQDAVRGLEQELATATAGAGAAGTAAATTSGAPGTARIVCTVPAATLNLVQMGAADQLVGVSTYDRMYLPEQQRDLPIVGDYETMNYEQVVKLRPTAIIIQMAETRVPAKLRETAGELNADLVNLRFDHVADIWTSVRALGRAARREQEAERAISRAQAELQAVTARYKNAPHPRVVYMVSPTLMCGRGTFIEEMILAAGGENAGAAAGPGFLETSRETVVKLSPDVLLIGAMDQIEPGENDPRLKPWLDLPVPAARAGRVYLVTDGNSLMASLNIGKNVQALADLIHRGDAPAATGPGDKP